MASGKRDPQALATELFARLDAARGSLGGTLPRAAAIATAAAFIVECCLPKRKSNSFAGMTDQEFKEYLLNTYTWLDVERELTKCSAWVRINIQGSTGQPLDNEFQRQLIEIQIKTVIQGDAIAYFGGWPR